MSEGANGNSWDIIELLYEHARQKEKIYRDTLEKCRSDERIVAYLSQFQMPEHAVRSYASQKAKWLVEKTAIERSLDYNSSKDLLEAQTCLGNIQQKKLFDKQCLWRAEMFTHPTIETTADFNYWEKNILNCPFIDPITEEDVALYIEFLETYLGENLTFLGGWQDYNSYNSSHPTVAKIMNERDEDANDENDDEGEDGEDDDVDDSLMPPWYRFVNERRGDGHYLLLPDVRQEKEWKYGRIGRHEQQRLHAEKIKLSPPDTRPYLHVFQKEEVLSFIYQVEDDPKEIVKAFETYRQLYDPARDDEMYWVKDAWENLQDCHESFPIAEGFSDWKEALIATSKQWKNTKIIRNLPFFYEDYLLRNAMGIQNFAEEERVKSYRELADDYKESILLGRELSGEPRDLNF